LVLKRRPVEVALGSIAAGPESNVPHVTSCISRVQWTTDNLSCVLFYPHQTGSTKIVIPPHDRLLVAEKTHSLTPLFF